MSQRSTNPTPPSPPKWMDDFSKSIASDVKILLDEVGKLRDERRALHCEIAQLMAIKSQHGPGGEFAPDWKSSVCPPANPPSPKSSSRPNATLPPIKPGWRNVFQPRKPSTRKTRTSTSALPLPEPKPGIVKVTSSVPLQRIEEPRPTSWRSWKSNPLATVPITRASPQTPLGLFGPRTPPPLT